MTRALALVAAMLLTAAALVIGWSTVGDAPESDPRTPDPPSAVEPSDPSSGTPAAAPAPADPPPAPRPGECRRLSYAAAVAPAASRRPVPCRETHTAVTVEVGLLDTVVGGHLVAVDSRRVRDQVARACPAALEAHIGGTVEQRRLSQLRSVWFTPTVEESDAGASWFRCDAVALAREDTLAPLGPSVEGVLDTEAGRDRYGLCATAEPGTAGARRVICSATHAWRAVRTVTFGSDDYPGVAVVRAAGEGPCRAAGRAASGDSLDFQWGYEWPTATQWRKGQRYGLCWVPD